MYVAMSRVKSIDSLFFTGECRRNAFTCNEKVTDEHRRLRCNQIISIDDFLDTEFNLTICHLNVIDIKHDCFFE